MRKKIRNIAINILRDLFVLFVIVVFIVLLGAATGFATEIMINSYMASV